jgi:glycosyltransferase involved in cell wall biosynthesis
MNSLEEKISIIIPAHNESESIDNLTLKIINTFEESEFSNLYEIIIVNDGSTDNTEEIGNVICKKYNKVTFINLKTNVSKPYALETGINLSVGEIIVNIDADLQYSTDDIIKMIRIMKNEDLDVVNGYRMNRQDPIMMKMLSKTYNILLRILSGLQLKDFWCGIKVYKKKIYKLMDYSGLARFIIFFSYKYNFKISEIKVDHYERKKGKTSYNFIDRVVLGLKDIFTLLICIVLDKKKIYQIKQLILIIYLFAVGFFIFLGTVNYESFFYLMISLLFFTCLNFIINYFLKSKEKENFVYKNYIKSIIKSLE